LPPGCASRRGRSEAKPTGAGWLGRGGDALRERARERALDLRRAATLHDDAAEALERHAHEVDRLQRLIEEIEGRARRLVDAARDKLDDRVSDWLDGFDAPPRGSVRWLEVEVPRW
jgi:hypothetical protein